MAFFLSASDQEKEFSQLARNRRGILQLNTEQTFWHSLTDACLCSHSGLGAVLITSGKCVMRALVDLSLEVMLSYFCLL